MPVHECMESPMLHTIADGTLRGGPFKFLFRFRRVPKHRDVSA